MRLAVLGMGITDDRGEYRLYGIQPGEYYVLAEINPKLRAKNIEVDRHQWTGWRAGTQQRFRSNGRR